MPQHPLDPYAAVMEFHRQFNLRIGDAPALPDERTITLRQRLIHEEVAELDQAIAESDIVGVADALADLLYVVYGTAISFGIDIRPVFAEVHRSNMTKAGGGTRADGKILKPADWQPPAIAPLLEAMRRTTRDESPSSDDATNR